MAKGRRARSQATKQVRLGGAPLAFWWKMPKIRTPEGGGIGRWESLTLTSARTVARDLGLAGWVRNCSDGSVEIHAEGDRKKLEELIAWCRQGPDYASVSNIDLNWTEAEGLSSFDIR